jgi:chemotaxis protein methyltransferase CheR
VKPVAEPAAGGRTLRLAPAEFDEVRRLARGSFGLDLKPGKEEMVQARLRRLVEGGGFRSFREYCRHVSRDNRALAAMIDALATNHTSFLREPEHFDFLRSQVLPGLAGRKPLEVWSAACSTGEEVWTLAMVLNDALPGNRIRIAATDISNKALRMAAAGAYSEERCQNVPGLWLSRYFEAGPARPRTYVVSPRMRGQVMFRRLNLLEPYCWPRRFPVIFCRNVMIYFDQETQDRVIRQLAGCLEPGGYLFVGHAESLARVAHGLEYVRPAVYRKPAGSEGRWSRP